MCKKDLISFVAMENGLKNMSASSVAFPPNYNNNAKEPKKTRDWLVNLFIIGAPMILCAILLIIFFFAVRIQPPKPYTSPCLGSAEANRSNLTAMLKKIEYVYFHQLHPEFIYRMARVTPEDIRRTFRPFDPSPEAIKNRTDIANETLNELNALKFNRSLLKLRERKAVHVARAILRNNFGWAPYGQDYYIGDWLLGPNIFCWNPVCSVLGNLNSVFSNFKPRNITELEKLRDFFEEYNRTIERYMENWKLGVRTGYVRPLEGCRAGLHNIKYMTYRGMTLKNESGIYDESFANNLLHSGFFEHLSEFENKTWKELYLLNVTSYFNRSLVQNIARPLVRILRYLEREHLQNCPSETYANGLGSLPLSSIFYDDQRDTRDTPTHTLPTKEQLSGRATYQALMRFFTTLDITPVDLRKRAVTRLDELYEQAVDIAKKYTNEQVNTTAIDRFKDVLRRPDMSFNNKSFPSNESDNNAFIKCTDDESAQKFCPQRWKAMQAWIKNSVETMKNNIRPVLDPLFYNSGPKRTIPACPAEVVPWYLPAASFHSFNVGSKDCNTKSSQGLPFFLAKYGPKWTQFTTTSHEQLPGHQLEVQSFIEFFQDNCTDPIHWLSESNYFTAMTEGWATYAEGTLLLKNTNLYTNTLDKQVLLQKYGVIYYQLLAALRVIVDIDLNYYGKRRAQVRALYKKYVWEDNTDFANKDIVRIISVPGHVSSYMIGELEITRLMDLTKKELGRDFSFKDFHYEVLRQGEYPLPYLEETIQDYIACKKDPTRGDCKEFL